MYDKAASLDFTFPPCVKSQITASTINPISLSHFSAKYVKLVVKGSIPSVI